MSFIIILFGHLISFCSKAKQILKKSPTTRKWVQHASSTNILVALLPFHSSKLFEAHVPQGAVIHFVRHYIASLASPLLTRPPPIPWQFVKIILLRSVYSAWPLCNDLLMVNGVSDNWMKGSGALLDWFCQKETKWSEKNLSQGQFTVRNSTWYSLGSVSGIRVVWPETSHELIQRTEIHFVQ